MADFKTIDISKITPSKNNYRRTFDKQALEELTESVRGKGILQPILVRPLNGNGNYEIVAGHRRFQAAIGAELKMVPAMVRDLSDEDALEIQVIENSHREDPNLIDEAEGFAALIKIGKHTPETLSEKLDKSVDYVQRRLRLLKLPKEAREMIANGEISLGHGLVLSRLRDEKDQKELLKSIIEAGVSVKEAERDIRQFTREIGKAPFDKTECETCPFLGKNQAHLFPELKKSDGCTDRGCYFEKEHSHFNRLIETKRKAGFPILKKEDAKNLGNYGCKVGTRIVGPESKRDGYWGENPKRYKTECMKCTEHHAFFTYVEDNTWSGKRVHFGEACTKPSCLENMNNPGKKNSTANANPYTIRAHALGCRDRFLKSNLPAKLRVEGNTTVQIAITRPVRERLLIYSLLTLYESFPLRTEIIQKYVPDYKENRYETDTAIYAVVQRINTGRLTDATRDVLLGSIDATDADVLLDAAPEAGIDMTKDWGPDETWLRSRTKDELAGYIKTAGLAIDLKSTDKKGEIIKRITEQDLKGKLPKELLAVITPEEKDPVEEACLSCDKGALRQLAPCARTPNVKANPTRPRAEVENNKRLIRVGLSRLFSKGFIFYE